MKFNKQIYVNNSLISEKSKVFIIAEAGVNHNGNMDMAKRLIDIAKNANADAIKFQAFKTESLILKDVEKAPYQKQTGHLESQFDMLKKLEISIEQNLQLKTYCEENDIIFLTTPFDENSLNELDKLNLPAYKIASTDTTNLPFLRKVAKKNKPIFLSTGMSYLSEIELALNEIYPFNKAVVLMQCSANYPLRDDEVNLAVINTYKKFNIIIGYSDHSVGIGAAPYAVVMGAKLIEKHFTIDKEMEGPDHKASLSPEELKTFVKQIRTVEAYLGSETKIPTLSENETRISLQKNLVASQKIAKGDIFSEKNITSKRTGGKGISPIYYKKIFGKISPKKFNIDEIIEL
ncbi:N,N'-diacetyllegionaminic acid synthase [Candidatus Magnetomoraceae bacterium gMMP-1]